MPRKRQKPEEIVAKLRQVDVLVLQGRSVAEAVRSIGVTQFTCDRWRKEFGGSKADQVKRLKEFEKENERLRKAVCDLTLEKLAGLLVGFAGVMAIYWPALSGLQAPASSCWRPSCMALRSTSQNPSSAETAHSR